MTDDHCGFCFFTVKECAYHLDNDEDEDKLVAFLWGAERCLRVLESVSNVIIFFLS